MPASHGFLGRKWPVPIMRPLYPFFIAGGIVYYGVWKLAGAMMDSDEYRNDPRNPNFGKNNKQGH